MRINVQRNGILLILLLFGMLIASTGITGRFGLLLGAIFTPEYLTETD